jgi:hypothetical protein
MAAKYWYVSGNGSAAWSVAGNWYNGSGGTGGVAGVPTTADDAIVNAASGSGTLTIAATSTCNTLDLSSFTGTLAGASALNIVTRSGDYTALYLGGTHTYSGLITFTSVSGATCYIECNNLSHKGSMTFNTVGANWYQNISPIILTGTLTLTAGNISGSYLYAGFISSSNTNVRYFYFDYVYLTGTGTLLTLTTQTNLSFYIGSELHSTSTASVARTISLTGTIIVPYVYIEGSGTALTTITSTSTIGDYRYIIVSKTGGTLTIGTSVIASLTFIEGSTITWASTAQLTVYGDVILCDSMSVSTSNNLFFGDGYNIGNPYHIFRTFNKQLTGWLQCNDSGGFGNSLEVYGNYNSNTISTNPAAINVINWGQVYFYGSVNLTTNITFNNSVVGYLPTGYFYSITSATVLTITNSDVSLGNTTLSGNIQFNSGNLFFSSNTTSNIFSLQSTSTTTSRYLNLGNNTIINLNGTGTVWSLNGYTQSVLGLDPGTSTIRITDKTGAAVGFNGGTGQYYNLNIDRSGSPSPQTTINSSNYFQNFKDFTINTSLSAHVIFFQGGQTTYIYDTFQVGNSTNQTLLYSTTSVAFGLYKLNPGLVICPNVLVYASTAYQLNTFYAISGSSNQGLNTNWIFDTPPRRMGSLGAG